MKPPHVSPVLGCRCGACHTARLRIWRRLSPAQRRAVDALSFAVPRHPWDLKTRDRVGWASLHALTYPGVGRPALVRQIALTGTLRTGDYLTFYLRTQAANEIAAAVRLADRRAA